MSRLSPDVGRNQWKVITGPFSSPRSPSVTGTGGRPRASLVQEHRHRPGGSGGGMGVDDRPGRRRGPAGVAVGAGPARGVTPATGRPSLRSTGPATVI